jgi:CheY-like chemotaxis protein
LTHPDQGVTYTDREFLCSNQVERMGVPRETGGRNVAKILVADDNSNVQKTTALALADLGVEVISVNNGEAAVRKLGDVSPDLVLADIFMPVRNGYEVCEYVKKDSRFGHIPVVLLVGAFDPLDEREAQRVGADGILKKPFVPPDPLIAMVKALLDRSMGQRLVAVSASKAPVATEVKAGNASIAEVHVPPPPMPEELSPEEFQVPVGRVSFGEGVRPVAFGQLLETPAQATTPSDTDVIEPVDNEQILTSSRDVTLGEPVFWRNDLPEVGLEAEHPADSQEDLSVRQWGLDEDSLPRREDAALLRPAEPVETLEIVREEQEGASSSLVDSEPVVLDPAAQSPLTVESGKPPELAANPLEWLATAPARHSDAIPETTPGWDEPIAQASKAIDAVEPLAHREVAAELNALSANEATAKVKPQTPQAPEDTARSVPIKMWAEITDSLKESASELVTKHAASISVPSAQVAAPKPVISRPAAFNPPRPSKPAGAINPAASPSPAAPTKPPEPSAPDPALVEAVVQRILDKMRPQVVDIITKEFLRPVVQALVYREIEKH